MEAPARLLSVDVPGALDSLPVAAWAVDPVEADFGFPWALGSPVELTDEGWEHAAFLSHFVSGLRDRYEHTFDSWGRIREDWHCRQLVPTSWVVEECADLLDVGADLADQYLLWRTLALRVPEPLFRWFAARVAESPADGDWPARWRLAGEAARREPTGSLDLARFGGLVPLCELDAELRMRPHPALGEVDGATFRRLLASALAWNLLPLEAILTEGERLRFELRWDGLARLRAEMQRDDPSGRIGTDPEGLVSDRALRLLLTARLGAAVAPPGLWAALGLVESGPEGWRLPLSPFCWRTDPDR